MESNSTITPPVITSKPKKSSQTIAGTILMIIGLLPGLITAAFIAYIFISIPDTGTGAGEDPRGWPIIITLWIAAIPILLGIISFITGLILFFVGRSKDKKKLSA